MTLCTYCGQENQPGRRTCSSCANLLPESASFERVADPDVSVRMVRGNDGLDQDLGEVLRLLTNGRKIDAIKLYRERTGSGLKESKEAVESLGRQHGIRTSAGPGGWGCLAIIVLVLLAVAVWLL